MTQKVNIENFATAVGGDIKVIWALLNGKAADLSALTTTEKTNLVLVINELKAGIDAAGIAWGASETDARIQNAKGTLAAPALAAWASTQEVADGLAAAQTAAISAATIAAVDQITNGAGEAYNSLIEIQNELQADDTIMTGLLTAVSKRLQFDAAQTLTTAEKLTACTNLGIGDPEFDFSAAYVAARDAV